MEEFDFSVTVVPSKSGASTLGLKNTAESKMNQIEIFWEKQNFELFNPEFRNPREVIAEPIRFTSFYRICAQEPNAKQFYRVSMVELCSFSGRCTFCWVVLWGGQQLPFMRTCTHCRSDPRLYIRARACHWRRLGVVFQQT